MAELQALTDMYAPPTGLPPSLLDWIDFKWLMAGIGHRLSIERLQHDMAYARQALALAENSDSATLRWAAQRLACALTAEPPVLQA